MCPATLHSNTVCDSSLFLFEQRAFVMCVMFLCLSLSRASFIAGLLGTAATNPIDVVKSRMMNQAVNKTPPVVMTTTTPIFAAAATPIPAAVVGASGGGRSGPLAAATRTHVYASSFDCFFTVSEVNLRYMTMNILGFALGDKINGNDNITCI